MTFQIDKSIVDDIMADIDLFYSYLQQNKEVFDEWYFKNVFTSPYWNYLQNYNWLSKSEQDYLHQGILNFILFMSYQSLEEKSEVIDRNINEVSKALNNYVGNGIDTRKLKEITLKALRQVEHKTTDANIIQNRNEIYRSLKWALTNIIINNKEKNVNRR